MSKKNVYKVGDRIQISLNNRILDAVIRAVIEQTDGLRLQVDFGHAQTALSQPNQQAVPALRLGISSDSARSQSSKSQPSSLPRCSYRS